MGAKLQLCPSSLPGQSWSFVPTKAAADGKLPPPGEASTFIPVHRYLLIEQGVHIGELHFLEELARDGAYEFCYVCTTNKVRGTVAGFALRPLAIR